MRSVAHHPMRSRGFVAPIIGGTTGMAVGVLVAVLIGVPRGGPFPMVALLGLVGAVAGRFMADRVWLRGPAAVAGIVIWVTLVVLAAGFVAAAIALSNFE